MKCGFCGEELQLDNEEYCASCGVSIQPIDKAYRAKLERQYFFKEKLGASISYAFLELLSLAFMALYIPGIGLHSAAGQLVILFAAAAAAIWIPIIKIIVETSKLRKLPFIKRRVLVSPCVACSAAAAQENMRYFVCAMPNEPPIFLKLSKREARAITSCQHLVLYYKTLDDKKSNSKRFIKYHHEVSQ